MYIYTIIYIFIIHTTKCELAVKRARLLHRPFDGYFNPLHSIPARWCSPLQVGLRAPPCGEFHYISISEYSKF